MIVTIREHLEQLQRAAGQARDVVVRPVEAPKRYEPQIARSDFHVAKMTGRRPASRALRWCPGSPRFP